MLEYYLLHIWENYEKYEKETQPSGTPLGFPCSEKKKDCVLKWKHYEMWPIAWYIFLYAQCKRLQHPREAEGPRRIGFHNKLALIVCQHSRSWKSSIHFRSRGKAQSLIFQLDLFIKTQQIFYIPRCGQRPQAGRAATAELGSPLESGDWGISHEQSMWISQEENTQHRSDDCHTHSLFSQHQGVKLKSARQHLDTNLAHGLVISPPLSIIVNG